LQKPAVPWHKLIVCGERPQEQRTKANKDLMQAACLLDYLLGNDRNLLSEAWDDVTHRGPGWKQRIKKGWAGLNTHYPAQRFAQRFERAGL